MPTTNQLAHNINMTTPKALKKPTQSDTHQKEDELQQGHLAAISLEEFSGSYIRALEYYATRRHLIALLQQHTAQHNTKHILSNKQTMYVYMDTTHYTYPRTTLTLLITYEYKTTTTRLKQIHTTKHNYKKCTKLMVNHTTRKEKTEHLTIHIPKQNVQQTHQTTPLPHRLFHMEHTSSPYQKETTKKTEHQPNTRPKPKQNKGKQHTIQNPGYPQRTRH